MVGCGALCRPVVNRYIKGLTCGPSLVRCWLYGSAADVQSTETPCGTLSLPRLLLMASWQRPAGVDRHPPQGGIARRALQGSPRPNAPHFSGAMGAVGTRAAAVPGWVSDSGLRNFRTTGLPVVAGLVSRSASPHSAPEQPASPAGHPVSAALRRDSHEGGGGCVCSGGGEQP